MKKAWEFSQNKHVAVLCNAPDKQCAQNIARRLISGKTAACVNILPVCYSVYQWHEKIQEENEIPLLIKTTITRLPEVESVIRLLHPYEMPEIIALPIVGGSEDYMHWISKQCD